MARGRSELRFGRRQGPCTSLDVAAHRVGLQLIDADLYDGTAGWGGEVLFHLAPLVFFSPYSILLGVVCSHCVQLHKRGVGVVLTPFGQCHCTTEMRGVIPLEIPVFTPPSAASLRRNDGLGRGGSFSFSPPCLLFPLFYFAWRCAQPLRATAQEGCWHFVCSISWSHRPYDEASNDAGAGNEWVSARRQKTRVQMHGNGELFAPPSAFAFERRARRVSSHRAAVVRGRRRKDTAAKETNAGQKRNL